MGIAARVYTPAEAATVSEVGIKAVHNAIDRKIVEGMARQNGASAARRALTGDDLLRLKLWYGIGATLASSRRQRLFEAIKARPAANKVKADDLLIVDVGEARKQIEARVKKLDEAEAAIHSVKGIAGGEPVFQGTRVPARAIAAMLVQGAATGEILEGYPALTLRLIELAGIWVAAHPMRGRPKKLADSGVSVKSVRRIALKGDPATRPPEPSA